VPRLRRCACAYDQAAVTAVLLYDRRRGDSGSWVGKAQQLAEVVMLFSQAVEGLIRAGGVRPAGVGSPRLVRRCPDEEDWRSPLRTTTTTPSPIGTSNTAPSKPSCPDCKTSTSWPIPRPRWDEPRRHRHRHRPARGLRRRPGCVAIPRSCCPGGRRARGPGLRRTPPVGLPGPKGGEPPAARGTATAPVRASGRPLAWPRSGRPGPHASRRSCPERCRRRPTTPCRSPC
jgi:hypothetical protein